MRVACGAGVEPFVVTMSGRPKTSHADGHMRWLMQVAIHPSLHWKLPKGTVP